MRRAVASEEQQGLALFLRKKISKMVDGSLSGPTSVGNLDDSSPGEWSAYAYARYRLGMVRGGRVGFVGQG